MVRYASRRADSALRGRILELAGQRPRFGYRRLHALLVRDGWTVNHKRVYRLYRAEGLAVRRKKRKRVARANRRPRLVAQTANEQWSMDFVNDWLAGGRLLRTLNILDDGTRECLAIEVDTSLGGGRVARVLERIARHRRLPKRIVVGNGSKFTGKALDQWAYANGVELWFTRPGKPIDNCFIESFNGKLSDECLNVHWFTTLDQAREVIEDWRQDYNHVRPHSSLSNVPPAEYAAQLSGGYRAAA